MKKRNIVALCIVIIALILLIALNISVRSKSAAIIPTTTPPTADLGVSLSTATYSFYGDTFAMQNGQATIQGHAFSPTATSTAGLPLSPVGYMLAATSTGTIDAVGTQGAVAAVYREFGANLLVPTLFAFTQNADGTVTQVAASDIINVEDAKIQSVSVANGTITLNVLVVSAADQQKPHYEQTPTEPETLQFQISGNQIIPFVH